MNSTWDLLRWMVLKLPMMCVLKPLITTRLDQTVKLGRIIWLKNYSKKFNICLGVQLTNWIKSGQPICFTYKRNTFLKLNTVNYCWKMGILSHFWAIFEPFLSHLWAIFTCFLHYSTLANKRMNNYSLWFNFSDLKQIIYSFWFISIQHYLTF